MTVMDGFRLAAGVTLFLVVLGLSARIVASFVRDVTRRQKLRRARGVKTA